MLEGSNPAYQYNIDRNNFLRFTTGFLIVVYFHLFIESLKHNNSDGTADILQRLPFSCNLFPTSDLQFSAYRVTEV